MAVPRVFYAMARDGLMPAALGRADPTARTPAVSILAVAFTGAFFAVIGSYDRLSSMATFGNILFFALNAWGPNSMARWQGDPDPARERSLATVDVPGGFHVAAGYADRTWQRRDCLGACSDRRRRASVFRY
jgi:APA family basic amino acid/polyamine antiporter